MYRKKWAVQKQKKEVRNTGLHRFAFGMLSIACAIGVLSGCGTLGQSSEDANAEVPVIAIENITLGAAYPETEAVEDEINRITVPEIGCKVKIVNTHIADHENSVRRAAAGNLQLDIVGTGLTTALPQLVADGEILPLDELLETEGTYIREREADLLDATRIGGTAYAISANFYPGKSNGIGYNHDVAQSYNLTIPETMDMNALTEIGQQLKESGSGIYLTSRGDGDLTMFDTFVELKKFDSQFCYGVIPRDAENQICNAYAMEDYRTYCQTLKLWRDHGYIPKDSLISGESTQDMFNRGELFFQESSVSPSTVFLINKKPLAFDEILVPITENRITTDMIQEFSWGISAGCEYPELAMRLMNFIYQNAEVSNLLTNGRENQEYVKIGDYSIRYPDGVTMDTVGYSSYFSLYGDSKVVYQFAGENDNNPEQMDAFKRQSVPEENLGYVFDADTVSAQVHRVSLVIEQYRPILETGTADDVDALLAEFNQKLQDAGIDEIIAENQRQLDAWRAGRK